MKGLSLLLAVAGAFACGAADWVGELPSTFASGAAVPSLGTTGPRSAYVAGDFSRFARVWSRLERGEPCRVAVIGGSITMGAGATRDDRRWASRFLAGWRRAFPNARFDFVNAGIGATGSDIGAFRLRRDVLSRKPDVVAVEFSVNDRDGPERAESYEGVLRQLLMAPGDIAVILLGMTTREGRSAQTWHGKVATHYGVPYVSYRDALFPYVKDGSIKWTDISPDMIHPNDDGHAYAAELVNWTLARKYADWKAAGRPLAPVPALPVPMFGTRFDQGEFLHMNEAKIVANEGFFPLRDECWGEGLACTNACGRLVFEVEGSGVALLYRCGNKPFNWGKIAVKIDGREVVSALDCYLDQWWWFTPSLFLCQETPGRHLVEVTTLHEKSAQSTGYGCHLTGLLVSGSPSGRADALRENLKRIGASPRFVYAWSTAQGDWRPKGPTEFHEKTGDDPLLTFYEFSSIVGTWRPPEFLARFRPLAREQIRREFRDHRTIPLVTWHMENPYAREGIPCGQAWYYRKKVAGYPPEHANVPREILEGTGSVCGTRSGKGPSGRSFANPREWFDWLLDQGIAFCRELTDDGGRQIPVVFRLFHEPDGGGFWWGYEETSPEDLQRLHRYAVDRLRRGLGAGNVLFCYGPDRYWTEAGEPGRPGTYLAGYPGDAYIDILGFDDYGFCHGRTPEEIEKNCAATLDHLRIVSDLARRRGKSCGIFESSAENTTNFYSRLHAVANQPGVQAAIMATYDGQWTFPKSAEGLRDMVETLRRPDVLTAKDAIDLTK